MKITDLLQKKEHITYSFEVTPDVSIQDLENLSVEPAFFSITWHAKSHECKDLSTPVLKLASYLRSKDKNVLLHLSCDKLRKDYLEGLLAMLQEKGICNLFVILGESYDPETSDFKSTGELIKYIRGSTRDYFCIGVAGFPDASEGTLLRIKDKVDAGADFVLTQAFFEANIYTNFLNKCEEIGVKVPVIPGIFVFETYKQLIGFTNMCKVKVSDNLLEYAKSNEDKEISGTKIIQELIQSLKGEGVYHYHFFTLNKLDAISSLVKTLE